MTSDKRGLLKRHLLTTFLFSLLAGTHMLHAQANRPYHLNGNAAQEDCNCYTITNDSNNQSGSVWNINKIDLTHPFDYHFNIFLGCRDVDGADGIAFVLQPLSTGIGTTGQGLGIEGVAPSMAVAVDTYQNANFGDPHYDHLAIHLNGDLSHNSSNNIAGPVTALENSDNIEDCEWHIMRIAWNPATTTITVYMDGRERMHATIDLLQDVFDDDPLVFWGFSGATGAATNHQRFCTSLNPLFSLAKDQVTCYPEPVLFRDSSTSFGDIVKWFWDFGDGTTATVQNPGMHAYPEPGNYTVSLNITGNDGCISDTFRLQVVSGSKPLADFSFKDPPYCDNKAILFDDRSTVTYGTLNEWNWMVNGNTIPDAEASVEKLLPPGDHTITLKVKSREGCISETTGKTITIQEHPHIQMEKTADACKNEPVLFVAANSHPPLPVQSWHWDLGDGTTANEALLTHTYHSGGTFHTTVYALGPGGCSSDTLQQEITIYATNAFAGNDTVAAIGQPIRLQASGGDFFTWTPASGLNDPNIPDPVAIIQNDATYVVTAGSAAGCPTTDTVFIKAYKGPEFYVPNAFTPNGDSKNDVFRFVAAGMTVIHYFKVFNRYGQLVYSSTDPSSGWNGNLKGKPQTTGAYMWMIGGQDYRGNHITRKGTVTLIR